MDARLIGSVVATTVGLSFWWGLTEPLPMPPVILLGIPAAILFCAGIIAGRLGVLASPVGLVFSLLGGSILATRLHQAFVPSTPPVAAFGAVIALSLPELIPPLVVACLLGLAGGMVGERLVQRIR